MRRASSTQWVPTGSHAVTKGREKVVVLSPGAVWPSPGGSFPSIFNCRKMAQILHFHGGICGPLSCAKSEFLPSPEATNSHLSHSLVAKHPDLQPLPCKMAMTYHPQSMYQSLKKRSSTNGFVRMSAFCSVVQQYLT